MKSTAQQILIAEDNDDLREILVYLIKFLGFRGQFATNGKEALEMILSGSANTFDAILSDIEMPEMNGFDLLIKLRQNNFHQPFIFMTAAPTFENISRAGELGIKDILEKPFDAEQLKRCLHKVLRIEI